MSFQRPLLVADHAEGFGVLRDTLPETASLLHAPTMADAVAALEQQPALVLCGCDFDEGGLYDLLRRVKAHPGHAHTPFLAVRCSRGEMLLEDTAFDGVKMAVTALGGDGFVDLVWWRSGWGEEEASRRFTQVVVDLLSRAAG